MHNFDEYQTGLANILEPPWKPAHLDYFNDPINMGFPSFSKLAIVSSPSSCRFHVVAKAAAHWVLHQSKIGKLCVALFRYEWKWKILYFIYFLLMSILYCPSSALKFKVRLLCVWLIEWWSFSTSGIRQPSIDCNSRRTLKKMCWLLHSWEKLFSLPATTIHSTYETGN